MEHKVLQKIMSFTHTQTHTRVKTHTHTLIGYILPAIVFVHIQEEIYGKIVIHIQNK